MKNKFKTNLVYFLQMRFSFAVCVSLALCGTIFAQINPQLTGQFRPGQVAGIPGQIGIPGQMGTIPGQQFNQMGMIPGQMGINQFGTTFPGQFNQFGMGINSQLGRGPSLVPSGQLGGFTGNTLGFNQFGTTGFNTPFTNQFGTGFNQFGTGVNQFGTGINQFGTGINQFGTAGLNTGLNGLNNFNRLGQPNMIGQFPGQMNQFNTLNPGLRQPVGKIAIHNETFSQF